MRSPSVVAAVCLSTLACVAPGPVATRSGEPVEIVGHGMALRLRPGTRAWRLSGIDGSAPTLRLTGSDSGNEALIPPPSPSPEAVVPAVASGRRTEEEARTPPAEPGEWAQFVAAGRDGPWRIRALGVEMDWPPNFEVGALAPEAGWPFELRGPFLEVPSPGKPAACTIALSGPYAGTAVSARRLVRAGEQVIDEGSGPGLDWIETVTAAGVHRRRLLVAVRSNRVVLTCEGPAERAGSLRAVCDALAASVAPIDSATGD